MRSSQENVVTSLKDAQAKAAIIYQRQKIERLDKMKLFGLLPQNATEKDAETLETPMLIPFDHPPQDTTPKDL